MINQTGVLLMTFGSAVTSADVPAYLTSVRGGRTPSSEVLQEFQHRYDVIGRSPLIDITHKQAQALQRVLDADHGAGAYMVRVGMLHSEPHINPACDALAAVASHVVCIALAPQYSPLILAGYERAIAAARGRHPATRWTIAGAWHRTPGWIDSLATRLREALDALPTDEAAAIPIVFTAHSLPRPVVDRDPGYITQLRETAADVARAAGLDESRWQFAYQSAGHTPEEWLTPDVKDLLPRLAAQGAHALLVVPVQFLADHLEILYDIDVAAGDEAREHGIELRRVAMPNASPALVRALADVVLREAQPVASLP